ncbi:hypothetical protein [Pseudomonas serbica]|jgi:hypothetical protein|uniref:hypothetical protein n=1 Tax=Pseudomonas serbica TaxID=2965074 RepID=UPI00237BB151|nr:hypothetical protein [Pseudomonas serbica]
MTIHANATAIKQFGQWFVVTAETVDERRKVEARANLLWVDHREPTLQEWESLETITASQWLHGE